MTSAPPTGSPVVRIALDATPLLDARTGVGTFVAEVLPRLGLRPDLAVVGYGLTRRYHRELVAQLPPGVAGTSRPIPQRSSLKLWARVDRPRIDTWVPDLDVVHGTNFVVPPSAQGVELVTVHDLTCLRFPELCDDHTRRYPQLIRRAIGRGAHVHTVSAAVASEVQEAFGLSADRVHVVHNGVGHVAATGDGEAGRARAGSDVYVLAVGTIEPRKNYPLLVEAFDLAAEALPDLALVIAGRPGWGAEAFDAALASAKHRDRVRVLGWVSDEQRADLLAGAQVLAYPSRYEGFGLPPLEAMAAGVPVVATSVPALHEVLGDAALLVDHDADALADAIVDSIVDDGLRTKLLALGDERAKRYSWDRCATELAELYHRLAG